MVDPHFNPEEEKLLDQKYDSIWQPSWAGESRCWRIFVRGAILALAITLLWLTSLTLATTIAGIYVTAPTYNDAVNEWAFTVQIAQQEQANAGDCVTREIATCELVLNATFEQLLLQSKQAAAENDAVVSIEANVAALCGTNWEQTILSTSQLLKKIILNGTIYSNGTAGSNCSTADAAQLSQTLGDVSQQKSSVYLQNAQYSRDSSGFLDSAYGSAKNRTDYDEWYIAHKLGLLSDWSFELFNMSFYHIDDIDAQFDAINPPIQNLINCIGLNGSCSLSTTNAYTAYLDMKNKAETAYNSTRAQVNTYMSELTAFQNQLHAFLVNLKSVYDIIDITQHDLNTILSQFKIAPVSFGFPDPANIGTLPAPPAFFAVAFNIPSPEAQFQQVAPVLKSIMPSFANARQNVHDAAERWASAINNSIYFPDVNFPNVTIPNYFADYNPPPIHVDTSGFHAVTNAFLDASRLSLNGFNDISNINLNVNTSSWSLASIEKKLPKFSSFKLMSSPFSGDFNFYNVFAGIGNLMFLCISADIIYRIFSSISMIRKYTRMSELGLPQIDIREFQAAKQSTNPTVALYELCTSPMVLVIILSVIGLMVLGVLIAIYIPLYESYQNGCVNSNNGTLLTKNAYAFAFNYAASGANEQMGDGLSKYDKQRSDMCTNAQAAADSAQSNSSSKLQTVRASYDSHANDLALYNKCIVQSALPSDDATWLNLTNYSSPFSNATANLRSLCNRPGMYPTNGLFDASFNCSLLPPCNLSCSGPDQQALSAVTYDSGCTTEWTFHAGLFRALLGLLVYVCLNISRTLLMTAIIRLSWRQLTSRGFEFQGTCTKMGTCVGLEERLKKAVEDAIKTYERVAVVMLIGAILVHIPYLVVLMKFGNVEASNHGT